MDIERFHEEKLTSSRTHILQAESDENFQAWVSALQAAISSAIHNSTLSVIRKDESNLPPVQDDSRSPGLSRVISEKAK